MSKQSKTIFYEPERLHPSKTLSLLDHINEVESIENEEEICSRDKFETLIPQTEKDVGRTCDRPSFSSTASAATASATTAYPPDTSATASTENLFLENHDYKEKPLGEKSPGANIEINSNSGKNSLGETSGMWINEELAIFEKEEEKLSRIAVKVRYITSFTAFCLGITMLALNYLFLDAARTFPPLRSGDALSMVQMITLMTFVCGIMAAIVFDLKLQDDIKYFVKNYRISFFGDILEKHGWKIDRKKSSPVKTTASYRKMSFLFNAYGLKTPAYEGISAEKAGGSRCSDMMGWKVFTDCSDECVNDSIDIIETLSIGPADASTRLMEDMAARVASLNGWAVGFERVEPHNPEQWQKAGGKLTDAVFGDLCRIGYKAVKRIYGHPDYQTYLKIEIYSTAAVKSPGEEGLLVLFMPDVPIDLHYGDDHHSLAYKHNSEVSAKKHKRLSPEELKLAAAANFLDRRNVKNELVVIIEDIEADDHKLMYFDGNLMKPFPPDNDLKALSNDLACKYQG